MFKIKFISVVVVILVTASLLFSQKAIDPANMDFNINPGEDFFAYANGGWVKATVMPADLSRYGAFEELRENNSSQLKLLTEELASDKNIIKGTNRQKIADFFNSGMDENLINSLGFSPISPDIEKIKSLPNKDAIIQYIVYLNSIGVYPFFRFGSTPDAKNVNNVIAGLNQGGLGLADKDYYLKTDSRSESIREAYKKYIKNIFNLLGYTIEESAEYGETVFKLETELAKISFSRYELQDPQKNYNKMSFGNLLTICQGFNWNLFINEVGIETPSDIDVSQVSFFEGFGKLFETAPLEDIKLYLIWNLVRRSADYLSADFVNESFEFNGKFMTGVKEIRPRWKRVLDVISFSLGEALGQLYVEKYFPPEAKARVLEMVNNIKIALKERINGLTWMGPDTKAAALKKLDAMGVKIGYPDKWKDYSKIEITSDSFLENINRVRQFNYKEDIQRIGKPYDKTRWGMTPQTVNASYSPTKNEITFPAGILQPPFFFANGDDAVNYGGIGVVIGHEITHGFDDHGKQFDADGNMTNWWSAQDSINFEEKTTVLVEQFNKIYVLDTFHVDGKLTLGENISDLGGLTISLTALRLSWKRNPPPAETDGFTPLQRYFLSYAQIWRSIIRDKELMRRLKEDVHSPAVARVNGIVYNMPDFYEAFKILPSDKMYKKPEERAVIW